MLFDKHLNYFPISNDKLLEEITKETTNTTVKRFSARQKLLIKCHY